MSFGGDSYPYRRSLAVRKQQRILRNKPRYFSSELQIFCRSCLKTGGDRRFSLKTFPGGEKERI